ncbi:MAG: patatin-like phospholipase family protein [Armatimonadetes bacterium]|nr:patatin-like phospholipase family protein [Armatimonadota bacterium]
MSESQKINRKKIGLVLGSGGIKCFAAISILKFLKQNNIPVDLVVGCSGGSIVATMWGAGYSPEQIEENVSKVT